MLHSESGENRVEKGFAAHPSRRKRFLIVSDSVGTPIHPRGIFHYTTNLIHALHRCGHEVSLLVEQTPIYRLPRREEARLRALSETAAYTARLGAVYNYLWQSEYIGRYPGKRRLRWLITRLLRWPSRAIPLLSPLGVKLLLRRPAILPQDTMPNRPQQLEFVPPRLDHLRACSEFVLSDAVYSVSLSSCALGLGPPTIDARGFDVILVDTPSYLRFERSPGTEIIAVFHDLIPLSDPTVPGLWRRVFANKVAETLADVDSLVFVSESTRRKFCETFPSRAASNGTVLHPSVADDIADDLADRAPTGARQTGTLGADGPRGDYLISIISDEPRKNIANLLSAWALLPAEIGLKLIGHVDPERYGLSRANGTPSRVEMLGYVDEATKKRLLADALGLVMPSYSEGFGIPLVEAFFFGKPVFCSDLPVFHEVAGESGIYFAPSSPKAIADAVRAYLADPAAFRDRINAGREQSRQRFSLTTLTERVAQRFGDATLRPLEP